MKKSKENEKKLLVETFDSECKYEILTEGESKEPKWIINGVMAKAGIPTLNKTIYSKEILNKTLKPLQERVKQGLVRILLDHPEETPYSNGTPSLERAAALMIDVSDVQEDGNVYYKAKVLNNKNGDIIKSILEAGGKVGNSTRGYGSIKEGECAPHKGKYKIVQEDYEIRSTDFVEDPAVLETERSMKFENNNRSEEMKTIDELRIEFPGLIEGFEATFKSQVEDAAKLKTVLETVIAQIKAVKPETFQTLPESQIVAEREVVIAKLNAKLVEAEKQIEHLNAKIAETEKATKTLEMNARISKLRVEDAEFFKFKSLYEDLDKCSDADEVQAVYEAKKKLAEEFKAEASIKTPKTENKTEEPKTENKLTEAQENTLKLKNAQRLAAGMKAIKVEDFLKSVK